jgi:hypothetical protein
MAKNLGKVTSGGACEAKTMSENTLSTPWVIYNPNSTNFKVLYSVNGSLNESNHFYGGGSGSGSGTNEFANCGSNSGSNSGN